MVRVISQSIKKYSFVVLFSVLSATSAFAALDEKYFDCVLQRENSGGTPATKNKQGYLGNYQLGVPAATDAGICNKPTPAHNDWSSCDFNGPLAKSLGLTGSWAERYAQFTTGSQAASIQLAAAQAYSDANWRYVKNSLSKRGINIDSLIGTTHNGIMITRETVQAMAHLLGHADAAEVIATGKDATDANKTSGKGYGACVGNCVNGGSNSGGSKECSFTYKGVCS